jgi:guanosine-3',5'-bis(diphosphate) 3'-pyrophosphohydrolase
MTLSTVDDARNFALMAHRNQRYSDQPYSVHLEHVVAVLHRYDINNPEIIAAAWLHDVIEDTEVSPRAMQQFGSYVAHLVWCVTNQPGANRRERNAGTYPKIRSNRHAILVKLADRIANAECSHKGGGKLDMYRKEYAGFRDALYFTDHVEAADMWARLDELLANHTPEGSSKA